MPGILIEIANETSAAVDSALIHHAVSVVLKPAKLAEATISVAVVDNHQMWELNRKYLDHDYPTDVLSFRLSDDDLPLEGDVIVNHEMAAEKARQLGDAQWTTQHELVLYVVHGTLHLVGYDDTNQQQREEMQRQERAALQRLGILRETAFAGRVATRKGENSS